MAARPATQRDQAGAELQCSVCGASGLHHYYRLATPGGLAFKCFRHALGHRPLLVNGLKTAAVVGTILTAINQGDIVFQGALTSGVLARIALTYAVPFLVSTHGALAVSRVNGQAVPSG